MTDVERREWMIEEHYICPECGAVDSMYQEYATTFMMNPTTCETVYSDDSEEVEYYWCEECSLETNEIFDIVEEPPND
jgi:hypothetical protein